MRRTNSHATASVASGVPRRFTTITAASIPPARTAAGQLPGPTMRRTASQALMSGASSKSGCIALTIRARIRSCAFPCSLGATPSPSSVSISHKIGPACNRASSDASGRHTLLTSSCTPSARRSSARPPASRVAMFHSALSPSSIGVPSASITAITAPIPPAHTARRPAHSVRVRASSASQAALLTSAVALSEARRLAVVSSTRRPHASCRAIAPSEPLQHSPSP